MYPAAGRIGTGSRGKSRKAGWQPNENDRLIKNGKRFVRCLCPRCDIRHNVYMLWTGRGVPRKYCQNCKPMVSGYDNVEIHVTSISSAGHPEKKRRRFEIE